MPTTVLLVDDHDDFRALARRLLEAGGFTIVGEASDAASAVSEAERLRPDVVVLDVGLPDGDGIDVGRQLTERSNSPAVVLVSSRDESAYGLRVRRSGVRGFIPKRNLSAAGLRAVLKGA